MRGHDAVQATAIPSHGASPHFSAESRHCALSYRMRPQRSLVERFCQGSRHGTVNLIGSGRDKVHEGRSHEGLCPSGHAGDLGPGLKGLGPGGSILAGGAVIAAEVEQVVDLIVSGEEALSLAS